MSSTDRLPHLPYRYGETTWDEHLSSIHAAVIDVGRAQIATMQEATDTMSAGFHDLQRTLNWGFTLQHDQMEAQRRLFEETAERLRKIEETLNTPTLTLAREAFTLGRRHIRQGLLVKGLEQLTKAEEFNDVDFLLQLQIGKLRLYGRNSDESVVDIDAAEKHLLLAQRYARAATIDLNEKVNFFLGNACYHLAILKYLRSSDHFRAHDKGSARVLLKEAIGTLAAIPTPLPEHRFFEARCQCLLGDMKASHEILFELCDLDRRFALVAREEPDFAAMAEVVHGLPKLLRATPGPATTRAFAARDTAISAIEQAKGADPNAEVQRALDELNINLHATDRLLDTGEIDAVVLTRRAESTKTAANEYMRRAYDEQLTRLRSKVQELKSTLVQPVPPFTGQRLPFPVLLISATIGSCVSTRVVNARFPEINDLSLWGLWIGTALLLTRLVAYVLKVRYQRDRQIATALEGEISTIWDSIRDIEAAKAGLEKP